MKTADLTGAALDYAVRILVEKVDIGCPANVPLAVEFLLMHESGDPFLMPSTDWAQAGPIIERFRPEHMDFHEFDPVGFQYVCSKTTEISRFWMSGPSYLIAAMRCYVASKLGDEVDVPKELL